MAKGITKSFGALGRMPSTRWQKFGGSDKPIKSLQKDELGDKAMFKASPSLGNPITDDAVRPAQAEKRQYLRSGKYIGKEITRKRKGM